MVDCKPVSTPAPSGKRLSLYDSEPLYDIIEFRSVVDTLQYLTLTCSDIAFLVKQVCQFMHKRTTTHRIAVKRILHYLKSTPNHGLLYKPGALILSAFANFDYAGDPDDLISTGVIIFFLALILFPGVPINKEVFPV